MHEDSLRRRLETLNRGPLAADTLSESVVAQRCPQIAGPPRGVAPAAERSSPARVGLLRQGDVVTTGAGEHLRIRLPLDALWPGGTQRVAARQDHLRQLAADAVHAVEPTVVSESEFAALVAALPDRVLWLDLETCGLAGSALFLVGLLRAVDGQPTIELLVARNYAEEPAILETLWQTAASHDVLVTFNGKSFDWPMVADRSIRHRIHGAAGAGAVGWVESARPTNSHNLGGSRSSTHPPLLSQPRFRHVDILHHARRRWRKQLPDCRLQTLELAVCRRRRTGDIPGHRIPAAYAEFVRTGFERDMDAILYHNALDLVTLLDLTLRLAG